MKLMYETKKAPEVECVASKKSSRPLLQHVHLNVENGTLEATDSYKAIVVPVEIEEGDTSGPIPAEALKAQRRASKHVKASINAGSEVKLETPEGTQTWPRPDLGSFPNIEQLTPTEFSRFRIGLNPALLAELAKGLGSPENVSLEFTLQRDKVEGEDTGAYPDALRPLRVKAAGGAYGILMPIRLPS